ncbi:MAG TPA: gliding motility-associated C-terminal domain-containing protein [Flavitalea sp.]|nr:gliding motility-associated C-terminal domain-containing protein [Flavitalea sp.]
MGASYTYSIDGTNFQSSPIFNDLPAGTFTITVVNATPGTCNSSTTATITPSGGAISLLITNPAAACGAIDLTSATIVTGSDAGLTYSYWLNPEATVPVLTPNRITSSGTYYIKATSPAGCSSIKPVTIIINPEVDPDVSITTSSTSVCNDETIVFTATTLNEGTNPVFQWKVNGLNVGTNSNTFSSNTLKAGDIVSVSLTSNATCAILPVVNSNTITLDDELVTPAVTITSTSTSLCDGATILFTATPVNGGSNPIYQWKVNGINAGTNSNTFSSNTLNDGDIVTVVMTSSAGCTTTPVAVSNEITMTANQVASAVTIEPLYNSSCEGSLTTFTATPFNGGTSPSYQWMLNGQPVGTNSDSYTTNTLKQGDVVSVVMNSNAACVKNAQASSNAEIVKLSAAPALIVNNPVPLCFLSIVDLTAPSVTAGSDPNITLTYWQDPAALTQLPDPNKVSVSGTYYIMATTDGVCSIVRPVTVAFKPAPDATLEGGGNVCINSTQTIKVKLYGTAPFRFTYTDGDQTHIVNSIVSNTYDLPVNVSNSVTYTVLSVSDANCTNDRVNSSVVYNVQQPLEGMRYETVETYAFLPTNLKARQPGIDYTYNWQPDIGLNFSNTYDPVFNYGQSQDYTIIMTSPAGCITVDTLRVNVLNSTTDIRSDLYVPNAWSPNQDGKNDELFPFLINIRVLKYFRVFNRWGQLMFEIKDYTPSTDRLKGWDGLWHGVEQPMDVYTWTVEAEGKDDRHFKKAGNAMLLR